MSTNTKYITCKYQRCRVRTNLTTDGYCQNHAKIQENLANEEEIPFPCGKCCKDVKDANKGIECNYCNIWFHALCIEIDELSYTHVKKLTGFKLYCDFCNDKVNTLIVKAVSLENRVETIHSEHEEIKKRLLIVENKLNGSVNKEITTALNEKVDIDRRKLNLVVYNLPEAASNDDTVWSTPQKTEDDIARISDILKDELQIKITETSKITDARRLGISKTTTGSPPKSRPMKIVFSNINIKREVLSAARRLRDSNNAIAKHIFINPDLTEAQRKKDKDIRDEMWKRREGGENVAIQKGEIITVTWEVRKHRTINRKQTNTNAAVTTWQYH